MLFRVLLFAGLLLSALAVTAEPPRSAVGTNLTGISYWSSELPFVDVMKSSSVWISGDAKTWDNNEPLDLDANGWVRSLKPGQIARKLMLREIADHYPAGQYVVRYKGKGTMKFAFAAKVIAQKPGEMTLEVTPASSGVYLTIEATDPGDYIRDIHVFMPGGICEGDAFTHVATADVCGSRHYLSFADHSDVLFYPVFLDRLRGYSVLRFMDWMATNNSPVSTWSDRTPLTYNTWATKSGVPIQVMVALANVLGADPWFTLPHQSDVSYALKFAKLVSGSLDPALKVYVEDSNEVWNSMFGQYAYARSAAAAQNPPIDLTQYHALRTRTVGQAFAQALGPSRVVTVLGAQGANPWTATHGLDFLTQRFGTSHGIDAVAIAPYFAVVPTPADAARYTAMGLDDFFSYVRTAILPNTRQMAAQYRKVADAYRLHLIAYEGGQHMVGRLGAENDAALNALFDEFNRDSRIAGLYLDYLDGWRSAGGELFVHFTDVSRYDKWGRWGALEYVAEPQGAAPKFAAIQAFIERNTAAHRN